MNRKVQVNRQQHFLGVVLKGSMLRMENVIAVEYCTLYNRCTVVIRFVLVLVPFLMDQYLDDLNLKRIE